MRTSLLFILITYLSLQTFFAQAYQVDDDQIGETSYLELPRIEVIPINDTQNKRQYELYVKLPEGYSENDSIQYPVLYTTDAMWHVEMLSAATEYIIEDIILVGISWQKDNKPDLVNERGEQVSRFRDYSVTPLSNPERQAKYQFGHAKEHLDFIRADVFDYIETNYRTATDQRSYFGYSLGGLFGAYALLARPDTFKNYILGSPAINGDVSLLKKLNSNRSGKHQAINVYISYGTLEQELGEYANQLISMLSDRNDQHLFLVHEVIEGSHQTAFPMTGVRSITWLSDMIKQ